MIRPRKFRDVASALRWSRLGGVALYHPQPDPTTNGNHAIYGTARITEAIGYSFWWAGKFGVTCAEVVNRGTPEQGIRMRADDAARLAEQCADGPVTASFPTTVVFFSGTRHGMSDEQADGLREWLFGRTVTMAHHGLCVGADEQFHEIVSALKAPNGTPWVVGWPGQVAETLTCSGRVKCDTLKPSLAPLTRNEAMAEHAKRVSMQGVSGAVELVACPAENEPPRDGRGGTWHTIRHFERASIPVTIIIPDGGTR